MNIILRWIGLPINAKSFTGIKDSAGNVAREVAGNETRDLDSFSMRSVIFLTENLLIVGL